MNYQALMRERGYRVTPQRELILDCVCAAGRHTTLDEIHARVRRKAPAINLATVYRTLKFMVSIGVVVTADTPDHGTTYEIASRPSHHHLVCRSCGQSFQIEGDALQAAFAKLEREQQFKVGNNHLTIFGLCKECQHAQ